jgi:hypothetical protein
MKSFNHFLEDCDKSISKYLSEDVNISGNASIGTIVIGGSQQPKQVGEQFFADIVWDGQLHRLEMFNETDSLPSREELTEKIQSRYPGAIVHQVYPAQQDGDTIRIGTAKRYHPSRLSWID